MGMNFRFKKFPVDLSQFVRSRVRRAWNGISGRLLSPFNSQFRLGNAAMFHIGRSGSTVVSDLLERHPKIFWDRELFSGKGTTLAEYANDPNSAGSTRWRNSHFFPLDPFGFIASRMPLAGGRFYGFEIIPSHKEKIGSVTR